MNQRSNSLLLVLALLCCHIASFAQKSNIKDYVRIEITPDHNDWMYRTGEPASFTIRVLRGNVALKNIPPTYGIATKYYSWGYNDPTCPPTSTYSAYNVIVAPKQLFVAHDTGHWRTKEQDILTTNWICKQLIK